MELTDDVQPVPASSFDQVEPLHSGSAAAEACAAAGRIHAAIFGFCSSGRVEPFRGTAQAPTNDGSRNEPGSCQFYATGRAMTALPLLPPGDKNRMSDCAC